MELVTSPRTLATRIWLPGRGQQDVEKATPIRDLTVAAPLKPVDGIALSSRRGPIEAGTGTGTGGSVADYPRPHGRGPIEASGIHILRAQRSRPIEARIRRGADGKLAAIRDLTVAAPLKLALPGLSATVAAPLKRGRGAKSDVSPQLSATSRSRPH